jgi:mannose-6-phosphate isomerase-like protein (cupin superfamily)
MSTARSASVLLLAGASCAARAEETSGTELRSQVLPASSAELAASGAFGEFRKLLTGTTRSVTDLLTGVAIVEPGQEIHPPHRDAEEEFLLLAKGRGTWHLDGVEHEAREGDLLYVEPWIGHGLRNTGDAPLTFFVVKWNGRGIAPPREPAAGTSAVITHSFVLRRDEVAPERSASGELRRFWTHEATPSLDGVLTGLAILEPGRELHPPHRHAEEELLWIVEGRGTWHLDGRSFDASAGDLLYAEPHALHGITSGAAGPVTFYVLQWSGRGRP